MHLRDRTADYWTAVLAPSYSETGGMAEQVGKEGGSGRERDMVVVMERSVAYGSGLE